MARMKIQSAGGAADRSPARERWEWNEGDGMKVDESAVGATRGFARPLFAIGRRRAYLGLDRIARRNQGRKPDVRI